LISVNKYSEEELVGLLKERREEGFAYLYEHYSGALFAIINGIVSDQELAADVLQEVFVNIFRRIEMYDTERSRLYTWMLNIARNAAIDMVRSKGFRQMNQNREITDPVYESSGSVTQQIDHIGIRKMLTNLKDDLKQVMELAYFSGYTQEEISDILKIPLGTVKTRIRAALKQLRELMQ
jgi:RNA polymerase sigma-70 factor (ECF subfamily)